MTMLSFWSRGDQARGQTGEAAASIPARKVNESCFPDPSVRQWSSALRLLLKRNRRAAAGAIGWRAARGFANR